MFQENLMPNKGKKSEKLCILSSKTVVVVVV